MAGLETSIDVDSGRIVNFEMMLIGCYRTGWGLERRKVVEVGRDEVETGMLATCNPLLERIERAAEDQDRKRCRPAMLEFDCRGGLWGLIVAQEVSMRMEKALSDEGEGWVGERVPGVGVPSSGGGLQSGVGPLGLVGVQSPLEGPSSRSSRGMWSLLLLWQSGITDSVIDCLGSFTRWVNRLWMSPLGYTTYLRL